MFEQTIETSATPHVTVTECTGNLVVRGSEERQITIQVQGGADDVALEREGETFTLTTRANCRLACPPATTLTVRAVRGNLKVEGMQGPAAIGATYGNVDLRGVGSAALEQVFGNLSARQVAGSLEAERVQGNIRLGPPFSPGATYRLSADSNLTVRLPADASLRLALRAGGKVRSSVPGLTLEETEGETRGVLGAGEASLEAQIGGNVYLRPLEPEEGPAFDFAAGLEGLGAQIEAHIAEAMAKAATRLEESLSHIDDRVIRQRVERATEKALGKAGQAAGQARRKVEHEMEKARLRAERAERRWRRASGQRSRPREELVSDEERLRVLRLVEEGKISPEQAADLLTAMEGR